MINNTHNIDVVEIGVSIEQIKKYITDSSVDPVIAVLEMLQQTPSNEMLLIQLAETLNNIGVFQGAVLTYAPYISFLISDDPFEGI